MSEKDPNKTFEELQKQIQNMFKNLNTSLPLFTLNRERENPKKPPRRELMRRSQINGRIPYRKYGSLVSNLARSGII